MSVVMPASDAAVLARRAQIVAALQAIVPGEGVIAGEREMRPYESDGLTAYRQLPMVVVLPETTAQVSRVLAYCHAHGGGRAWRHQPRGLGRGGPSRLLLRARPVIADRLHDRRQRGGEFGRRALPQIRHDDQ